MNKIKIDNQQNLKEIGSNMEKCKSSLNIISSLESIPGKLIKLQSDNFQSKKENLNKDKSLDNTEEKFSINNTLSNDKLSNNNYFIKTSEELCSQNLISNHYPNYNQYQLGYHTQHYFNYNSLIPIPSMKFLYYNNMIYPYKTLNSQCQMKSINCFKEFIVNHSNYIFNEISIPVRKVPIIQVPIGAFSKDGDNKEITQKKHNNLLNIENINKNKINIKKNDVTKNNKSLLNKKRNRVESSIIYFLIKKEKKKPVVHFNAYKKSKYILRKRMKRKKKNLNLNRIKINCAHQGCKSIFKTKKQLALHHYKMSIECHYDTITLLKMISSIKKLFLNHAKKNNEINNNFGEKYSLLYKEAMNNIHFKEYIEATVGFNLEN